MTAVAAFAGYAVSGEARMIRSGVYGGIIRVHASPAGTACDPPVAVIIPGQWTTPEEASQAALDYAAVMADDGALSAAIALREAARM